MGTDYKTWARFNFIFSSTCVPLGAPYGTDYKSWSRIINRENGLKSWERIINRGHDLILFSPPHVSL